MTIQEVAVFLELTALPPYEYAVRGQGMQNLEVKGTLIAWDMDWLEDAMRLPSMPPPQPSVPPPVSHVVVTGGRTILLCLLSGLAP